LRLLLFRSRVRRCSGILYTIINFPAFSFC
jgi:hypothetical protein